MFKPRDIYADILAFFYPTNVFRSSPGRGKLAKPLLKYLYDTYEGNLKVVATAGSAFYIDQKFKDSLAGRKRIFRLNTLNFRELLVFREWEYLAAELDALRERPEYRSRRADDLRRAFWEFLRFGGYPAVTLEPNERCGKRSTLVRLLR